MPDVNLDSRFDWGPVRLGFEEMRSFANDTTRGISRDVAGMFAASISVAAITGAIRSIVEEAHEIHATAERFRIDAQELQTIGNVARDLGIPLDAVGRAMNVLEVNAYKATQADNAQRQALEDLGISAEDFFKLNADEKVLRLAEAYTNAGDKAAAYAQIMELIGRRNAEFIRVIEQGADAIRKAGEESKFTEEQLAKIDEVRVAWVQFWHDMKVAGAEFFPTVVAPILDGLRDLATGFAGLQAHVVADFKGMGQGLVQMFKGDIIGGYQQILTGTTPAQQAFADEQARVKGMMKTPTAPEAREAIEATRESRAAASKELDDQTRLQEKLAAVERANAMARLSDGDKLLALNGEIHALQLKMGDTSLTENERLQARITAEEREGEAEKLITKLAEDKANYDEQVAKLRDQMAAQADQELADAQEATKELGLQLIGRKDLAERAKIEYEFNQKIHDAINAANEAEKQYKATGDKAFLSIKDTNLALVTQLSLEKQIALAAHDKATAEEMAAKAAQEAANVDREKLSLAALKEENKELDLKLAGMDEAAAQAQIESQFNEKITETLGEAADLWEQMAKAYADGNKALGDQLSSHAQLKDAEAAELALEEQKTIELIQQNALRKAQIDTIKGSIDLASEQGTIGQRTAQFTQQNVDLQVKSQQLAQQIDSAYATGNAALAEQLTIQKGIVDQQQNLAYHAANQAAVQEGFGVFPGTDLLGKMAAAGLHFGGMGDAAFATVKMRGGTDAEAEAAAMQMNARVQLEALTGRNTIGFAERAGYMANLQTYNKQQDYLAQQAAERSRQQEIDYWQAIASGRQPQGNNPFALMFGMPNFQTGQFTPLSPTDQASNVLRQLQQLGIQGLTQIQLLQLIQQNTEVVKV